MTEKEFNLSEKQGWIGEERDVKGIAFYTETDIKEFIKRLKDKLGNEDNFDVFEYFIDKLAGEKFK